MTEGFDFSDILICILGLYELACGIATIATGKLYGQGKNMIRKYTEESIHTAAPILAIASILIGIAMIIPKLGMIIPSLAVMNKYELAVLLGGVVLGIVFEFLGFRKLTPKEKK